MCDDVLHPGGDRISVLEEECRHWLDQVRPSVIELYAPQRVVEVEGEPHRGRGALGAEPIEAEWQPFAAMLAAGASHLAAAKAAFREQGRQAAVQARALAAFAAERPAAVLDRPAEEVGAAAAGSRAARPAALTAVSEWAVDEVMVELGLASHEASRVLTESVALVHQLPATLAALASGELSPAHARMLTEVLGPLPDEARGEVEKRLLARAGGKTVSQLREAARRAVLRADAGAAARRLAQAIRERKVRAFPGKDGMSSLSTTLPTPVARACVRALESYADECAVPGDERTKDQRMADCLVDLILRPGANGEPPVRIDLTVVAGVATLTGGDEPGDIDGQPVPAVLVRELAYALGLLPRPESPSAPEPTATGAQATDGSLVDGARTDGASTDESLTDEASTDGSLVDGTTDHRPAPQPSSDAPAAGEVAAARLAELLGLRSIAGTALTRLPQIAVVDEISGQLLALTSAAEIHRIANGEGDGLGPPPATSGYGPSNALQRFVRLRDRRCRFPGCRAPAIRCDLDHNVPWPAGSTSAENLCCLCRHHHRLSHQAPGWTIRRLPDDGLEWTTPGGERVTTHPPRYGSDDDLPPPASADRWRPRTLRHRVLGRAATPTESATDPPPF